MNHLSRRQQKRSRLRKMLKSNKKNYITPGWYIDPNKWKIRGWKRRVKYLNSWGRNIQIPSLTFWKRKSSYDPDNPGTYPYTRDRYTVYPWYNFHEHRQPPLWFFKIIIGHFVEAFENWNALFAKRGEPYDLFIRIYNPHFIESDIQCVQVNEKGDRYNFWPQSETNKPFPFAKFAGNGYDLSKFDWELRIEEDIVDDYFEYNGWNETKLLQNGYSKHAYKDGSYFTKPVGEAWVGRVKNE